MGAWPPLREAEPMALAGRPCSCTPPVWASLETRLGSLLVLGFCCEGQGRQLLVLVSFQLRRDGGCCLRGKSQLRMQGQASPPGHSGSWLSSPTLRQPHSALANP